MTYQDKWWAFQFWCMNTSCNGLILVDEGPIPERCPSCGLPVPVRLLDEIRTASWQRGLDHMVQALIDMERPTPEQEDDPCDEYTEEEW